MKLTTKNFYILLGNDNELCQEFCNEAIKSGLSQSAIISFSAIQESLLGTFNSIYGEELYANEASRDRVQNIFEEIINLRVAQQLPVVLYDYKINDGRCKNYIDLAKKNGYKPTLVVCSKELDTKYSFEHFFYSGGQLNITPNLIETTKLDIIGDTHGLLDEVIEAFSQCGWTYDSYNHLLTHTDPERKIVFLGDALDRGTQSLELLELIQNMCEKNKGYFILGNHEDKLISNYSHYQETQEVKRKSLSSSVTFMNFLKLPGYKRQDLFKFLKTSPAQFSLWIDKDTLEISTDRNNSNIQKFGFIHADTYHFDEYNTPRSQALYGVKRKVKDMDKAYEDGYNSKICKHIIFRGHSLQTSPQGHVLSLEDDQAFEGNLHILHFDKFLNKIKDNNWISSYNIFLESSTKFKTTFNFNNYIRNNMTVLKEMENLVAKGLATDGWRKDANGVKTPHPDGFKIYKYSKKVHFERLWLTNPWIEKARGIVLDTAGNIVSHPFDKLYNFGEYNAGKNLPLDTQVQKIEKMNGFLANISMHPFRNEIFATSQGSMAKDAPFVKFIYDFITPEVEKKLIDFFRTNKVTLMFENIHPDDPHIIEYSPKDYGLWLIGVRGLNLDDKIYPEEEVDKIAAQLGFKRPKWSVDTLGNVIQEMKTNQTEGVMIRLLDGTPVMKMKSDYYLITKFIGRIGNNMTEFMYRDPEGFKEKKMEEEFYPIVDKIVSRISQEEFTNMDRVARVAFVREIVNEIRDQATDELQKSVTQQPSKNKVKVK